MSVCSLALCILLHRDLGHDKVWAIGLGVRAGGAAGGGVGSGDGGGVLCSGLAQVPKSCSRVTMEVRGGHTARS